MATKFKVNVNGKGSELTNITNIIAMHNSGEAKVNLEDIAGYLKCMKALLPNGYAKLTLVPDKVEAGTIHLSDDEGETFYLSIQECIYEELISNPVLDQYAIENLSQSGSPC